MSNEVAGGALHPFERLTPDVVMDALASVGLLGDGRLQALSSYENRVYHHIGREALKGDRKSVV